MKDENEGPVVARDWHYPSEYRGSSGENSSISTSFVNGDEENVEVLRGLTPENVRYDYGLVTIPPQKVKKFMNIPDRNLATVGKLKAIGYRKESGFKMEESEVSFKCKRIQFLREILLNSERDTYSRAAQLITDSVAVQSVVWMPIKLDMQLEFTAEEDQT